MEKELKELLESKKSDGKNKKGCSSCKKKKVEVVLVKTNEEELWIPTAEDIKLAYAELTSYGGVKNDKKEFINKVYQFIFNEQFDWDCNACVNNQARRFKIYMNGK